jgi:DNA-binding response OmpR family regulator
VIDNLTISEEKVIKKLIEMEGKVVSYEDLGEYIWDNKVNQKYSMYAISQLICKLRKKLRQNKIYGEILHTVRGKGFVLTN